MALSQPQSSASDEIRLEEVIRRGLLVDPRVGDAREVAISAQNGFVTLTGAVDTFQQKRAIENDALMVAGVAKVTNALRVRRRTADVTAYDETIRAAAVQALVWNRMVPDRRIEVEVSNGCVHLAGDVDLQYEADAAYETVADLVGVVDVAVDLRITSAATEAGDLIDRVTAALRAHHRSSGVAVHAWRGEVTLTGTMRSLKDHDRALATVWAVPGVASVLDRLSIEDVESSD
jgi:osmotically-inducible protein OsmY